MTQDLQSKPLRRLEQDRCRRLLAAGHAERIEAYGAADRGSLLPMCRYRGGVTRIVRVWYGSLMRAEHICHVVVTGPYRNRVAPGTGWQEIQSPHERLQLLIGRDDTPPDRVAAKIQGQTSPS